MEPRPRSLAALWALLAAALSCAAVAGRLAAADPGPAHADSVERSLDRAAFPVALGDFSTTLVGSLPARTANIARAAAALDGIVLRPGEQLSFDAIVGPRTEARGYASAPVILRDARQFQTGGGVCQVASTLFVAGLLAGLTPVERFRHSTPVDYIPLGWDATIAWGAKDLKLRNDLEQPVRLRIEVLGSTLAARFDGESPLGESFELDAVERELPGVYAGGSSAPGHEVELYRVRHRDDGTTEREWLHRDVIPPVQASRGPR